VSDERYGSLVVLMRRPTSFKIKKMPMMSLGPTHLQETHDNLQDTASMTADDRADIESSNSIDPHLASTVTTIQNSKTATPPH
jgi:hypothetical protein